MDLALNEDMSVHLDDTGQFKTVDGYDEFEQQIVIMITNAENEIITDASTGAIIARIETAVRRIANRHELLDDVEYIDVKRDPGAEYGSYSVTIKYNVSDDFYREFDV